MDDRELADVLLALYAQRNAPMERVLSGELMPEEIIKAQDLVDEIENKIKNFAGTNKNAHRYPQSFHG
jgi:hypothetical protein